jgi:hypothetical protein
MESGEELTNSAVENINVVMVTEVEWWKDGFNLKDNIQKQFITSSSNIHEVNKLFSFFTQVKLKLQIHLKMNILMKHAKLKTLNILLFLLSTYHP